MKQKNYLLIVIFIIMIFSVPLLGMREVDSVFSEIENRNLQSIPVFEKGIEDFTGSFETYVVDQFPQRNTMLDIYTKLQLLPNKIKVRNTIVLEDWLFVKDYKIDEGKLSTLEHNLRKTITKNKEIDFYYVILPSKTAMLADLYPKYIDKKISIKNNEMLNKSLENIQRLNIVNLFDIFLDKYSPKERSDYYYQTDFHWNSKGSFKAFELLTTQINDYDTFKAAEDKLNKVEHKNKYFKGDLERRFSGNIKNKNIPDAYEVINTKNFIYYTSIDDKKPVDRKEIVSKNIDQDEVGYNDIFTYNLSCIRILNKNPIIEKKVLILKDSYFNAMIDPMSTVFSELIIIDPRYYNEDYTFSEILKEKNPDYVYLFYHQSNVDKDLVEFLGN
jgi:hypothetical protein